MKEQYMREALKEAKKAKTYYEKEYACDHCGSVYDGTNLRCPSCGAPKTNKDS